MIQVHFHVNTSYILNNTYSCASMNEIYSNPPIFTSIKNTLISHFQNYFQLICILNMFTHEKKYYNSQFSLIYSYCMYS